jgi:hypothetical protein
MWKNIVERSRRLTTIWHMRIACWITNATHTHTHTLRILTATTVTQKCLNVTLYVYGIVFLLNLAHFVDPVWLLRWQVSSSSAGISTVFLFMSVHLSASQLAIATSKNSAALIFTNKYKKEM